MPPKPKLVISACLTGEPCTYRGGHHCLDCLTQLEAAFDLVPLCPETAGGLPVPRDPSEIRGGRVVSCAGEDVTDAFVRGAGSCLAYALYAGCTHALLKGKSPSCGCGSVYDGTFSGRLVAGDGITAALFKKAGIEVFPDTEARMLIEAASTARG